MAIEHARRPSRTLDVSASERISHLGPVPRKKSLTLLAHHGRGGHAGADVDFEDMLSSVARFNRETSLRGMRWWTDDEDRAGGFARRSRSSSMVSVPGVRGSMRLHLDDEESIRNLDREEIEEKIQEMYALREMQCVRPGIGEKERWHYQGAGAKVARGEIASVKKFSLPGGRRHKDLRRRVHKLQVAQRNWQIKKLGRSVILGGDDVSAASTSGDEASGGGGGGGGGGGANEGGAAGANEGGGGDEAAQGTGGLRGRDAFVECRLLIRRLKESEVSDRVEIDLVVSSLAPPNRSHSG